MRLFYTCVIKLLCVCVLAAANLLYSIYAYTHALQKKNRVMQFYSFDLCNNYMMIDSWWHDSIEENPEWKKTTHIYRFIQIVINDHQIIIVVIVFCLFIFYFLFFIFFLLSTTILFDYYIISVTWNYFYCCFCYCFYFYCYFYRSQKVVCVCCVYIAV